MVVPHRDLNYKSLDAQPTKLAHNYTLNIGSNGITMWNVEGPRPQCIFVTGPNTSSSLSPAFTTKYIDGITARNGDHLELFPYLHFLHPYSFLCYVLIYISLALCTYFIWSHKFTFISMTCGQFLKSTRCHMITHMHLR